MDYINKYVPLWGKWEIDSFIGSGSFGELYKIKSEENGKTNYASIRLISISWDKIKTTLKDNNTLTDSQIEENIKAIALEIVKKVQLMKYFSENPNILRYEDYLVYKKPDNKGYDVLVRMEYLENLQTKMKEKTFSPSEIANLAIDICKALEEFRTKNIVHKKIAPDNVFIDKNYKIGDFGIGKPFVNFLSTSKDDSFVYLAPEVYINKKFNNTIDTYSLGLLMYQLLNNNFIMFYPKNLNEYNDTYVLESTAKRMVEDFIPLPKNAPKGLTTIVLKACAYNEKDRYNSPSELRAELETYLSKSKESVAVNIDEEFDLDLNNIGVDDLLDGFNNVEFDSFNQINSDEEIKPIQNNGLISRKNSSEKQEEVIDSLEEKRVIYNSNVDIQKSIESVSEPIVESVYEIIEEPVSESVQDIVVEPIVEQVSTPIVDIDEITFDDLIAPPSSTTGPENVEEVKSVSEPVKDIDDISFDDLIAPPSNISSETITENKEEVNHVIEPVKDINDITFDDLISSSTSNKQPERSHIIEDINFDEFITSTASNISTDKKDDFVDFDDNITIKSNIHKEEEVIKSEQINNPPINFDDITFENFGSDSMPTEKSSISIDIEKDKKNFFEDLDFNGDLDTDTELNNVQEQPENKDIKKPLFGKGGKKPKQDKPTKGEKPPKVDKPPKGDKPTKGDKQPNDLKTPIGEKPDKPKNNINTIIRIILIAIVLIITLIAIYLLLPGVFSSSTQDPVNTQSADNTEPGIEPPVENTEQAVVQDTIVIDNEGDVSAKLNEIADKVSVIDLTINDSKFDDFALLEGFVNLEKLTITNAEVSSVEGVEKLTTLKELNLSNNNISSINKIAELANLTVLDLNKNVITDITPIFSMTSLTSLSLSENKLSGTEALKSFVNLEKLELNKTDISDINFIKDLTKLKVLALDNNFINDATPVAGLTTLEELSIQGSSEYKLETLDFVTNLTNLKTLILSNNNISSLAPLANITSLESLVLNDNKIIDGSPLANLTNLNTLSLKGTVNYRLASIDFLANLTNLKSLSIVGANVTSFAPLKNLTNLEKLIVSATKVTTLDEIKHLTNLTSLTISQTNITDLSPVSGFTNLKELKMVSTKITDLSPIATNQNLTLLSISSTPVTSLDTIKTLTSLETLDISGTQISDITSIENFTMLKNLNLTKTPVTSLKPLSTLLELEEIYLSGTQVTDLADLGALKKLKKLEVPANIPQEMIESLKTLIPNLEVTAK